jgi:hypothetical protein
MYEPRLQLAQSAYCFMYILLTLIFFKEDTFPGITLFNRNGAIAQIKYCSKNYVIYNIMSSSCIPKSVCTAVHTSL